MEYMRLTPDTGVEEMDIQHRGIVDRINNLADLPSKDRVEQTIDFLSMSFYLL